MWQGLGHQEHGQDIHSADLVDSIVGARGEIKRGYNSDELYSKAVSEWVERAQEDTPDDCWWYIAWRKDRKKWILIYEDPLSKAICHTHDVIKQIKYLEEYYLDNKLNNFTENLETKKQNGSDT